MIESMTGYGKHSVSLPLKKITVEIKTLNSKHTDINMRMPSSYRGIEIELRKIITKALFRGKIEVNVHVEKTEEDHAAMLNQSVIKNYLHQLGSFMNTKNKVTDALLLQAALRLPDVYQTERFEEIEEPESNALKAAVQEALKQVQSFRYNEGIDLKKDFEKCLKFINDCLEKIITLDPERIERVKKRIDEALSLSNMEVDENRLEQELLFYLEKLDISEEISRLKSHLAYFQKTINEEQQCGKKIGFIAQEMGREINTIGSKANAATSQKLVVLMKNELEKIKEQVLNTL